MLKHLARLVSTLVFDWCYELFKDQILAVYTHAIESVRKVFLAGVATAFCLLLITTGFLLFHLALYLVLPWTESERALLFFILSAIYMTIPIVLVVWLNSRLRWLRICGLKK